MYQSQIGDSTLLNVQATTLLQNAATLQANILARNDTYLLTAAISAGTLVWVFWRLIRLTDCPYRVATRYRQQIIIIISSLESL